MSPYFHIILIDQSAPHQEIPRQFVRKHLKNKIPKFPIIRSANGGYSWKLQIEKIEGNYCFGHGWNNVVHDINLGFGDFLYFVMVDQSTFQMSVYGLDCCEKVLPEKMSVVADDDSEDVIVDDDDDVDEVDDDVDEDVDDVEEVDEEEEDDDEFDDDDDDGYDDDDDDVEEEDEEDDVDADIDGNDGDPFFTVTITATHKNLLRLKPAFLSLAGITGERPITLTNSDGEEWPMELRLDKTYKRHHLTSGWSKFARNNNLSEGDKCVFKFIKSEDKLCLVRVTKRRCRRQRQWPPRPRPRREIPAGECNGGDVEGDGGATVVKRSRGRPRKRLRGRPAQQKNGDV